jgi:copper ion binding protein
MRKILIAFFAISSIFAISTKKVYNVEGMMCGVGCVNTINSTLKNIDGVKEISVDFENKSMEVVFDDEDISSKEVVAALPNLYKATFIKETISKKYAVSGITCMGCVNDIRTSIKDLDGLETYEVSYEEDMLYIEFDVNKTTDKDILNNIPLKFKVVEVVLVEDKEEDKEKDKEEDKN